LIVQSEIEPFEGCWCFKKLHPIN